MDGDRFDRIAMSLAAPATRRTALGVAAGLGLLRGASRPDAAAKRKKRCGVCRGRTKGTCKPKPFGTPCGACRRCERGACTALCAPESCVNDICLIACNPPCQGDEDCFAGVCSARCDPACESDEACVGGACVGVGAGCTAAENWCADEIVFCPDADPGDACVLLNGGQPYCAASVGCKADGSDLCQTDADCRNNGDGPNARCVANCSVCDGGNGCVVFYLDF